MRESISENAQSDCSVETTKIAMDTEMVSLVQREKVRQYFMMCSLSFRQFFFVPSRYVLIYKYFF